MFTQWRWLRWMVVLAVTGVMSGMSRDLSGQAEKTGHGARATVRERMERVEKGIEPVKIGNDAPIPLDLAALMKLYDDPALSVALIDGFQIVWAKAYGMTQHSGTTPVTTKTLFQAGS